MYLSDFFDYTLSQQERIIVKFLYIDIIHKIVIIKIHKQKKNFKAGDRVLNTRENESKVHHSDCCNSISNHCWPYVWPTTVQCMAAGNVRKGRDGQGRTESSDSSRRSQSKTWGRKTECSSRDWTCQGYGPGHGDWERKVDFNVQPVPVYQNTGEDFRQRFSAPDHLYPHRGDVACDERRWTRYIHTSKT